MISQIDPLICRWLTTFPRFQLLLDISLIDWYIRQKGTIYDCSWSYSVVSVRIGVRDSTNIQKPVEDGHITPMEDLLGKALVKDLKKKVVVSTKDAMMDRDLVLLYFSASWCPPCQAFSPVLKDFYGLLQEAHKFEIVYVSSDRTLGDFEEYYGIMPWLAIPMTRGAPEIKKILSRLLQIRGIPTLIVLDPKTGKFITNDAKIDILGAAGNLNKYKEIIAKWKSMEPVPIEEGFPSSSECCTML
jgi:nucleoredoxin